MNSSYGCGMIAKQPDVFSVGPQDTAPTARLRILETTDLHMHLLDYDYFTDHPDGQCGLIRLLDQIETLRAERGVTSLLFDNGDFLQGNPLADYFAKHADQGDVHPMINAFNVLNYDAVTIGNHEFNYGLPFLRRTLKCAQFPVVCANIHDKHVPPLAQDFCILERALECSDGQTRPLKIGVVGFVTPKITEWDRDLLKDQLTTEDIVVCAKRLIPHVKAAGADIIVALCHAGIAAAEYSEGMENPAIPLAGIDGIDVVLAGHTHELFPDSTREETQFTDPVAGTLHGKPAVMAGFFGNRLGVIDLNLRFDADGWQIDSHTASVKQGSLPTPAVQKLQDAVIAGLQNGHQATLDHIRQPIAETTQTIQSYFATITPDLGQQLLAEAQIDHVTAALPHINPRETPIISATAPFLFGGRAGPGHYIDVPNGPLTLRDAAAIYPFANTLCAFRRTGADLRAWLERAAAHFEQLRPGQADQPLISLHSPGYDYDMLYGLRYEIDLSQPARYSLDGLRKTNESSRIRNLTCQGEPVSDDQTFLLATNSYRTYGGGNYPNVPDCDIIYRSTHATRDILVTYLRRRQTITDTARPIWSFTHLPDTRATFMSSAKARKHMTDAMRHVGPGPNGFDAYQLIL